MGPGGWGGWFDMVGKGGWCVNVSKGECNDGRYNVYLYLSVHVIPNSINSYLDVAAVSIG